MSLMDLLLWATEHTVCRVRGHDLEAESYGVGICSRCGAWKADQ